MRAFQASTQIGSPLRPTTAQRFECSFNGIDLKLRFDLAGTEGSTAWRIFYNCRDAELDGDVARMTLELAALVLSSSHSDGVPMPKLQYVDLKTGKAFVGKSPRARTLHLASANAKIITTLSPRI